MRQKATGLSREAVTNGAGFFVITNLASRVYELKVQAKGFAEKTIPSVILQVGQTVSVEVPMAVTIQESVTLDNRSTMNSFIISSFAARVRRLSSKMLMEE